MYNVGDKNTPNILRVCAARYKARESVMRPSKTLGIPAKNDGGFEIKTVFNFSVKFLTDSKF